PRLHSLIITFCLFFSILPRPPSSPLFPYTTLFRSPSLPLEPVRQRVQRLVIEAGAELARRAEDVGDVIVRGHEQGAVRPGAFPSARERSDHDEVNRVAERRTVLFLELDPLVSAPAGVVRGVKGLRHEPLAPGLEG